MKMVLIALASMASLTLPGCSPRSSQTSQESSHPAPPIPATPESPEGTPETPDPLAARRAQLLSRIEKLTDSDCDYLVLRFQLIPRDEILEPISKPRKDLIRYVRNISSVEDLNAIERAIDERKQPEKQASRAARTRTEDA